MSVSAPIQGAAFRLRPVESDDAAFLLELRTDPELTRYLPPLKTDVAGQQAWIERQREAPHDFYYVVERQSDNAPQGAIGLYNRQPDGGFEWGRWLIRSGSLGATESVLLLYRFAFEDLGLPYLFCRSIIDNHPVVGFHDSAGLRRVADLPAQFEIGGQAFDAVEHRLDKAEWPDVEARLSPLAQRIARRITPP